MKVLIADDDQISRMITKAAVEQSGHDCIVAVDGDSAWDLYQEHAPAAVVTDLMMPGLNGLDLCRAIREGEQDTCDALSGGAAMPHELHLDPVGVRVRGVGHGTTLERAMPGTPRRIRGLRLPAEAPRP